MHSARLDDTESFRASRNPWVLLNALGSCSSGMRSPGSTLKWRALSKVEGDEALLRYEWFSLLPAAPYRYAGSDIESGRRLR